METEILQTILVLAIAALYIPACFVIARKAGYSGWYSLLMLIPVLNLLVIYLFAFSTWPAGESRPIDSAATRAERLPNS